VTKSADQAPLSNGWLEYVTARNDDGSGIAWQYFVNKILRDQSKRMQLWVIMPWSAVARMVYIVCSRGLSNMNDISIDHPEAMVQDDTANLEELNHMTSKLREGRLARLPEYLGKNQSVPWIGCP
jgi:hypothetical protein